MKKTLSILLSAVIITPNAWCAPADLASTQAVEMETEKMKLATNVAESLFYVKMLEDNLVQKEQELNNIKDSDNTGYTKVMTGATIALGALTLFLAYKTHKANDVRTIFYAFGTLISGGAAAGVGINSLESRGVEYVVKNKNKNQLLEEIKVGRTKLAKFKHESESNLSQLESLDPDIRVKIATAISDNKNSLERFKSIRAHLVQAKSELNTQNSELGISALFAGSSLLNLLYNAGESTLMASGMGASTAKALGENGNFS